MAVVVLLRSGLISEKNRDSKVMKSSPCEADVRMWECFYVSGCPVNSIVPWP